MDNIGYLEYCWKKRPDVQYNKDGKHYNVEFDWKISSSEKHRKVVTPNDPNAVNEFRIIKKK